MQRGDRVVFAAMLVLSAGFAGAAGLNVYRQHQMVNADMEKQILHVSPAEVIGPNPDYLGDPRSPYTLVEFGDYQCPPCRAAQQQLPGLLRQYQGKVKFVFRNLPLTQIHPYAMQAAIVAETAREHGFFWKVHDALYQTRLDRETLRKVRRDHHIGEAPDARTGLGTTKGVINSDILQAEKMGVNSTPSFILTEPSGKVLRLTTLDQLRHTI